MALSCNLHDQHYVNYTKFCCQLKIESNSGPQLQWILCASLVELGKHFLIYPCIKIPIVSLFKHSYFWMKLFNGDFSFTSWSLLWVDCSPQVTFCTATMWNLRFLLNLANIFISTCPQRFLFKATSSSLNLLRPNYFFIFSLTFLLCFIVWNLSTNMTTI